MTNYRFTNLIPRRVCRICGAKFSKDWSDGGVGAICENCFDKRYDIDLVEEGIICNIKQVGDSFTFQAKIDDKWYNCSMPCGNWSYVNGHGKHHKIFSVPVGYHELKSLYDKHYAKGL